MKVNRLFNSNASELIKERARLLSSYFSTPTFVDFADNFTYAEVAAEPWLYEGCYVRWSGQVSNLGVVEDAVQFTLLVGYEAGSTGTVSISGTAVVAASGNVTVGRSGTGRLEQSGGELTFGGRLNVGSSTGSIGSVAMSGGDMTAGVMEFIGPFSTGVFTQTLSSISSGSISEALKQQRRP